MPLTEAQKKAQLKTNEHLKKQLDAMAKLDENQLLTVISRLMTTVVSSIKKNEFNSDQVLYSAKYIHGIIQLLKRKLQQSESTTLKKALSIIASGLFSSPALLKCIIDYKKHTQIKWLADALPSPLSIPDLISLNCFYATLEKMANCNQEIVNELKNHVKGIILRQMTAEVKRDSSFPEILSVTVIELPLVELGKTTSLAKHIIENPYWYENGSSLELLIGFLDNACKSESTPTIIKSLLIKMIIRHTKGTKGDKQESFLARARNLRLEKRPRTLTPKSLDFDFFNNLAEDEVQRPAKKARTTYSTGS